MMHRLPRGLPCSLPGVNLGVNAEASLKGDGVGSMTRDVELEAVDGELGVPKGKQRRLLVGR